MDGASVVIIIAGIILTVIFVGVIVWCIYNSANTCLYSIVHRNRFKPKLLPRNKI